MPLLYYIPGRRENISDDEVADLGLDYALERPRVARRVEHGPDGQGAGTIAARTDDAGVVEFHPDGQTWVKHPDANFWVGHNSQPTLPEELARGKQLRGHWVMLADGNRWLCPIIRGWDDDPKNEGAYTALPRSLKPVAGGQWEYGEPEPKYADVLAYAEAWENIQCNVAGSEKATDPFLVTAAVALLSINYRIGPVEQYVLRLIQDVDDTVPAILNAAIDWATRLKWLEKKTGEGSVGSVSSDGPADLTEATDQR